MFKRFVYLLLIAFTSGVMAQASAVKGPDALVRDVTEEVLTTLRSDPSLKGADASKTAELVETRVLPHFNFTRMTALALGKEWRATTPEQKKQLTEEFRTLLVRTYSNALTSYRNQTIDYKPFKMGAADTDVTVRTQINQPGGRPIALDYALEKQDSGWKVYDVMVAGVSLVTNYRETFAAEVRAGGVNGLIKTLRNKNSSNNAGSAAQSASAGK